MGAYLIDHPPARRQFKERGTTLSGVVLLHTAENLPDFHGPDAGAEGVASFIRRRSDPGSYHWLADSDSLIDLVPVRTHQAYGEGTGTNPHATHISAATQAHRWASLPDAWVEDTVRNMAVAAHRTSNVLEEVHGVRIPARWINEAEARARREGFGTHAMMDSARRSDPGKDFPRKQFLGFYEDLERGKDKPDPPSRGKWIDTSVRRASATLTAIEKANDGPGPRGDKIREAEEAARATLKELRDIAYLGGDKK